MKILQKMSLMRKKEKQKMKFKQRMNRIVIIQAPKVILAVRN